MTTLNTVLTSKQFSNFVSTNKAGQLDAAALFALEQINKRNTQYINKLFNLQMLRLINGDLNKLGSELKGYIQSFKLANLQWQGDRSRWQYIDAEQADVDVFSVITFTAYREAQTGGSKSSSAADKPLQAKALLNNFSKLSKNGLSGKPDEMAALLSALEAAQADILKAIAAAKTEDIDTDKVEQLANLKPSSKEKSAPQKVAL